MSNNNKFIHLHLHALGSLRDGVCKLDPLISRVKELGGDTLVISEHGNLYTAIMGYFKCKEAGIKFIPAIEEYIVNDVSLKDNEHRKNNHITLLAKNNIGYKNLLKLTYEAAKNFYYKPRIDFSILSKHAEGLICLSGCLGGELQQALLKNNLELAENIVKKYKDLFGEDYYLEIMNNGFPEQEEINLILPRLAQKFNVRIVATNDVHYIYKKDKLIQDALYAIDKKTTLSDPSLRRSESEELYLKSYDEMLACFPDHPEWLEETVKIAEKCNVELKNDKLIFPSMGKDEKDKENQLRELCKIGWNKLIKPILKNDEEKKTYGERVKRELDVIVKNGFSDYFLLVSDICREARTKKIRMSKGRGSVGGCLIAYLLGITEIDPIKYDLSFERFLNKDRISPPDIDLDFADERRHEIIEYVEDKYGKENCCRMLTFGNFQPRQAIRDSFKVYDYDIEIQDKYAKAIPDKLPGVSNLRFKHFVKENEVKELEEIKEKYPEVYNLALSLEELPRQLSTHASAYIITDIPVQEYAPMGYDAKNGNMRLGIDMYSADKIKLLKVDFLGLETLTILDNTLDLIKKRKNIEIDINKIDQNNEKTWESFINGDTIGIFQFESDGIRGLLKRAKPINTEELAHCNAIYRPGAAKFIPDYCDFKHGIKEKTCFHPLMEPVLRETYNILCIAKGSKVLTNNGQKNIEEINKGDLVLTEDGTYQKVLNKINNGKKKTIRIRSSNGEELICTPNHKVLTQLGWIEAKYLKKNHLIKSFWVDKERKLKYTNDQDWLIGLALADGDLTGTTFNIACESKEFAERVKEIADKSFELNSKIYFNIRCWYVSLSRGNKFCNKNKYSINYIGNKFTQKIKELDLFKKNSYTKRLPKNYSLDMIAGFIEGDGSLNTNRIRIKNKDLAYDIYLALQSYRIPSSFFISKEKEGEVYTVSIKDYKKIIPYRIKKIKHSGEKSVFFPKAPIFELFNKNKMSIIEKIGNVKYWNIFKEKRDFISYKLFNEFNISIDHSHWSKVSSVKTNKTEEVYDLSIEKNHSFIVGGLVVHNCYQEQISKMCEVLAGFTPTQADYMRKAIGKKKEEDMIKLKPMFAEGCRKKGISENLVEIILSWFSDMSRYNFNKSHAIGYSLNAYDMAYIKSNYPLEFTVASLNKKTKEINDYLIRVRDAKKRKIKIQPPNINKSLADCSIVDEQIYFGLGLIKDVSYSIAEKMVEERKKNGVYKDYYDFLYRNRENVEKSTIVALSKAGSFDCINVKRSSMETITDQLKYIRKLVEKDSNQVGLFDEQEISEMNKNTDLFDFSDKIEYTKEKKLKDEKEVLGFYISGSPLEKYNNILFADDYINSIQLDKTEDGSYVIVGGFLRSVKKHIDKNGNEMAFCEIEDDFGPIKSVIFNKKYKTFKYKLKQDNFITAEGYWNNNSLSINKIKTYEEKEKE